jgi:hypothetical protein
MGAAIIDETGVVVRSNARPGRVRQANSRRNAFSAGIGAEIVIEAAVLLHDEHKMLNFFKTRFQRRRLSGHPSTGRERGNSNQDRQQQTEQADARPHMSFNTIWLQANGPDRKKIVHEDRVLA